MQNIYLSNIDLNHAIQLMFQKTKNYKLETQLIDVCQSLNHITSEPIFSKISSPNFNASAMDGIAVKTERTHGADETNPIKLKLNEDYIVVDTGDPIKEPFTSVIMIEDVVFLDDSTAQIIKPASPWQHIRPIGEDIVASEMIVTKNHIITPVDINAFLSSGLLKIPVYKQITIGIIPTGDEITEPTECLPYGKIIESNSRMFETQSLKYYCSPKRYNICLDNIDNLKAAIQKSVDENDITIINAGSSAGREDFTSEVVNELGEVFVHGISIKPGKPTVIGLVDNKPVIGIPGYPVASFIVYEMIVKTLIYNLYNIKEVNTNLVDAYISKRVISPIKYLEFVPVKLGNVNNKIIATPLNRGSGIIMSLVRADGFLEIDKNLEGYEVGDKVKIKLTNPNINNTLVSIGSHDLIMDIINNLMKINSNFNLSSSNVGSLGGILALKRSETHIAPIHLLDEVTGEYNISYIQKYFKDKQITLIRGVKRSQGIIVKKGNPKNINSIKDLQREDVLFVNRQKGSGTRILLDYLLKTNDIDSSQITGYDREMNTHMAVCACVNSDSADACIGVYSAAKALSLDFIEIGFENYDFILETSNLKDEKVKMFLQTLTSEDFKNSLYSLGGYKHDNIGEIIKMGV